MKKVPISAWMQCIDWLKSERDVEKASDNALKKRAGGNHTVWHDGGVLLFYDTIRYEKFILR